MSEISSASVRFSGPEEEQLVRYRALNKLAILALLLGLASSLTLVHPLLLLIPAAGIVCALVSLRTIRANSAEWTGAGFATAGLVLSLFFLGWSLSWTATRPARLAKQAEEFASDWMKLVQQNQLYSADQLRQSPLSRAPLTGRLDDFYRSQPPELQETFNDFAKSPVIEALAKAGPDHPPEFQGVVSGDHSSGADTVTLRYRLPAARDQPMWSIVIKVHRDASAGNGWQIGTFNGKPGEEWPE